jgi:hypothetical protein
MLHVPASASSRVQLLLPPQGMVQCAFCMSFQSLLSCAEVQQLKLQAPDSTLSSRISTQPVWLWLHPKAWANKLTCLQLQGVPLLSGTASLAFQGLTQLQRLCLTGTHLRPSAVEHLLHQLSSCEQLTALVLSGNDMCLLPEQGWEGVTGLKVRSLLCGSRAVLRRFVHGA